MKNKTKNTMLAEKIELADSFFSKMIGLMLRKALGPKTCMLFTFGQEDYTGIWMLFMRFPIDLVYLDGRKRVITIYENIRPVGLDPRTWKVYYPDVPAKYVIELASGSVKKTRTVVGDVISF
jgi:uncharacterized membrane protein (UPF0127 family)